MYSKTIAIAMDLFNAINQLTIVDYLFVIQFKEQVFEGGFGGPNVREWVRRANKPPIRHPAGTAIS